MAEAVFSCFFLFFPVLSLLSVCSRYFSWESFNITAKSLSDSGLERNRRRPSSLQMLKPITIGTALCGWYIRLPLCSAFSSVLLWMVPMDTAPRLRAVSSVSAVCWF